MPRWSTWPRRALRKAGLKMVQVSLDGNGDIYYCRVGEKLGNLWQDDLVEVWENHPLLKAIRGEEPQGACQSCQVWSQCRGGCPAITHGLVGEVNAPDLACPAWSEPQANRFVSLPML